jgi:hypothetical protein
MNIKMQTSRQLLKAREMEKEGASKLGTQSLFGEIQMLKLVFGNRKLLST